MCVCVCVCVCVRECLRVRRFVCGLCHACHAKAAGPNGTRRRQGVHPTPWHWKYCHACHAKAANTKRHQETPRHTSDPLGNGDCATPPPSTKAAEAKRHQETPARTSDPLAVEIVPHLPRKSCGDQTAPGDARAYIRPLGIGDSATPATQKLRRPNRTRGYQGIHPTPWQ